MKYMADDGTVFQSSQQCLEHEEKVATKDKIRQRVQKYLRMKDYKTEGSRKRAETIIMSWVDYDMIDNPERYVVAEEVPQEPEIAIVRSAEEA